MGGPAIVDGKKIKELDNFYICKFKADGVEYPSAEHFFQAQKVLDPRIRKYIASLPRAHDAWEEGQKVELRQDWENIKVNIMFVANYLKFFQNKDLAKILIDTMPHEIVFKRSTEFWNNTNAQILSMLRGLLKDILSY